MENKHLDPIRRLIENIELSVKARMIHDLWTTGKNERLTDLLFKCRESLQLLEGDCNFSEEEIQAAFNPQPDALESEEYIFSDPRDILDSKKLDQHFSRLERVGYDRALAEPDDAYTTEKLINRSQCVREEIKQFIRNNFK